MKVGAGEHTVEFRYEPLSWRIGWITSLLSLLGLAVAVASAGGGYAAPGRPPRARSPAAPADAPAREPDVVERR